MHRFHARDLSPRVATLRRVAQVLYLIFEFEDALGCRFREGGPFSVSSAESTTNSLPLAPVSPARAFPSIGVRQTEVLPADGHV
jgi:hypothetical protein